MTVGLQEAPASMNLKLSIIQGCIIFTSYEDILYKKNQLYSTLKPIYWTGSVLTLNYFFFFTRIKYIYVYFKDKILYRDIIFQ